MTDELIKAIAQLGKASLASEKLKDQALKEEYLSNPDKAFLYFLNKMFYRGRIDRLSEYYFQKAGPKVKGFLGRHGWHRIPSKDTDELYLRKPSEPAATNYKFPHADFEMVYGAMDAVSKMPDNNVVKWTKEEIEAGSVQAVYDALIKIKYIKNKLSCLFFRDVVSLYDLIDGVTVDVQWFLPVDTWVRQFCNELGLVSTKKASDAEVKAGMVDACRRTTPNVSPINFDHGLWVLSQLQYILRNFDFVNGNLGAIRTISQSSLLGQVAPA